MMGLWSEHQSGLNQVLLSRDVHVGLPGASGSAKSVLTAFDKWL